MNELSLFTGAGGGLLATQWLLKFKGVGYVENNAYCQGVLARRMEDGFLHSAPIFGDIRRFNTDGYAEAYQGMVDVVSAGFPCQPFSVAGKQAGEDDPRNMWPATIECIRLVRPRFAFLENVPGLLARIALTLWDIVLSGPFRFLRRKFTACYPAYFGRILGDLAEAGYDAEWCVLGADDCGAPHKRKRLWVLAYANETGQREQRGAEPMEPQLRSAEGRSEAWWRIDPADLPDAIDEHDDGRRHGAGPICGERSEATDVSGGQEENLPNAENSQQDRRRDGAGRRGKSKSDAGLREGSRNWPAQSRVGRVDHGVAHRVDRLRALGNGQVPSVAAAAWRMLHGRIAENGGTA